MRLIEARLRGVWRVELERSEDERGWFARTYCEEEFRRHGLNLTWPQINLSSTSRRGMLRGLHFQAAPRAETKYLRCLTGAVFDVVVDLRPDSTTYGQWEAFELNPTHGRGVYIPAGCAHGFQSLMDDSLLLYQMSDFYDPALARGVRWDDPSLNIAWPIGEPFVSERDRAWPRLSELQ
jgi:dTDP-4-dehydrorhamnose 3,5-epimerase